METTKQINRNLGAAAWSASIIDKIHPCADCPIRQKAIKQPKSIFAKLHTWHRTWWPGWKSHQARMCPYNAGTKPQS